MTKVSTSDGWALALERRSPSAPWATALLLPAMMADRRSLDRPAGAGLASALVEAGVEVLLADFRGHGASGPRWEEGGRWGYEELVERDLPALVEAATRQAAGRPLWIAGHSLGGHVALAAVATGRCPAPAGMLLFAVNMWHRPHEPRRWRWALKLGAMAFMFGVAWIFGRFPARRLRVGPQDEDLRYVADLWRYVRTGRWASAAGEDYLAACTKLGAWPRLSILGAGDRLYAHPAGAARFAEAVGAEVVIEGLETGLSFEPGHMGLVTDPRAAPAWARAIAWMRARTPGAPDELG